MSRAPRVQLARLDAHHDVSTLNSGNEVLDAWLRRHAIAAQHMDTARTFIATRRGRAGGYVSLTMGSVLLAEALRKAVAAGEVAAARLIVVDAVDEDAAVFYQRYGFIRAPENPLRFYRRMKDVRASLDSSTE